MIEFARPWLLVLAPALLAWWTWRFGRTTEALPQFLPPGTDDRASRGYHLPHPRTLRLVTLLLLVLALAGPQIRRVQPLPPEEGLALVVALDLSGSMGLDIPGGESRLHVALEEITRFVQSRTHDRIGLVTFAEEAITRVPPTTDHVHLLKVLHGLEKGEADEGTALGMGLGLAAHATLNVPNPSRVVLLLTDGRSNTGTVEPLSAAKAAATLGVRIHAIGVGPESGEDPLDEPLLRSLVNTGNGRYFRARDASGLRRVLSDLDKLETGPTEERAGFSFDPRHGVVILLALILLALEGLLRATPWGRLS